MEVRSPKLSDIKLTPELISHVRRNRRAAITLKGYDPVRSLGWLRSSIYLYEDRKAIWVLRLASNPTRIDKGLAFNRAWNIIMGREPVKPPEGDFYPFWLWKEDKNLTRFEPNFMKLVLNPRRTSKELPGYGQLIRKRFAERDAYLFFDNKTPVVVLGVRRTLLPERIARRIAFVRMWNVLSGRVQVKKANPEG